MDKENTVKKGRPFKYPNGFRVMTLSMSTEDVEFFKKLGGSSWLREQLAQVRKKSSLKK